MSCGIYAIVNKINSKRYIGKSINIESRWSNHLYNLRKDTRSKDTNRHLFGAFKKYGEESFGFEYLEIVEPDDVLLAERELYWITKYNSLDRNCGYNLRLDSDSKCIVSDETRELIRKSVTGESNPNYGNAWTDDQKIKASEIAKRNHELGRYSSEETRRKHSEISRKFWEDNPDKKEQMKSKVSEKRTTYKIGQYTMSGELVRIWDTMLELLKSNPDYHRISIYSCMNGHKKSYRSFVWRKVT